MKLSHLMLLAGAIVLTSTIMTSSQYLSITNAQTPTTSDLPSTIGNESNTDLGLSNDSLPAQNATTIPITPPV